MKYFIFLVYICSLSSLSTASPITLEESAISEKDKNNARNVVGATQAPNSLLGGAAESMAKTAAEGARNHTNSCQSGNCDYVIVGFDAIVGFSTADVDLNFSMRAVEQSTGRVEPNASKNGATIYKLFNPNVSGYYLWSATWDSGNKICSGKSYVSGKNGNITIRVYEDCSDAGSYEF